MRRMVYVRIQALTPSHSYASAETRCANTGGRALSEIYPGYLFLAQSREAENDAPVTNVLQASVHATSSSHVGHASSEAALAPIPTLAPSDATPTPEFAIPMTLTVASPDNDGGTDPQAPSSAVRRHTLRVENFEFLINFEMGGGINRIFNFVTSLDQISNVDSFFPPSSPLHSGFVIDEDCQKRERSSNLAQAVEWLFDPLIPQAKAIWEKLLKRPHDHNVKFNDRCIEFFNPPTLRRLLDSYWRRWHWHCPIIHLPSLDLSQIPTEMVMVMSLLGAFVSLDNQDVEKARQWLDVTEDLVFSIPWLSRHDFPRKIEPPLTLETKLRLMQTAHLISALQIWEGTESARTRIRDVRYLHLIQVSREVDCVYQDLGPELNPSYNWKDFILDEQVIRTKTFIFLLDSAFTIFNNMPPRVTIASLTFPFPCPDECFRVDNREAFLQAMRQHNPNYPRYRKMYVCDVIRTLCDTEAFDTMFCLPEMTVLNEFILISGVHSIIACQEMSCFLSSTTATSLFRALDRWLHMWKLGLQQFKSYMEAQFHASPREPAAFTGFARHSYEYYCLALAKLELINEFLGQKQTLIVNGLAKGNVKGLIWKAKQIASNNSDNLLVG
ncbi:hypothetical protein K491DRAFT_702508 [Lophiostoma macrostomum CBS 122681]|uniref:Transcription factor domain-containing protein n=1 Tax=Lophiostoma macrostomum CBS 122681 TaxID=1314788 RepID=A0A6A6TGL3_9PLEO|nr:hypothetical protein K491DRAFT_702508 [Lophiostoma macrostomum CBS 122681]